MALFLVSSGGLVAGWTISRGARERRKESERQGREREGSEMGLSSVRDKGGFPAKGDVESTAASVTAWWAWSSR